MEQQNVSSQTEIISTTSSIPTPPILRLRLQKKKKPSKKVDWTAGTVDNEHLNRKKSKCCCIYKKPLVFGESSSEDEEECEHCHGHPEKKVKNVAIDEAECSISGSCPFKK